MLRLKKAEAKRIRVNSTGVLPFLYWPKIALKAQGCDTTMYLKDLLFGTKKNL